MYTKFNLVGTITLPYSVSLDFTQTQFYKQMSKLFLIPLISYTSYKRDNGLVYIFIVQVRYVSMYYIFRIINMNLATTKKKYVHAYGRNNSFLKLKPTYIYLRRYIYILRSRHKIYRKTFVLVFHTYTRVFCCENFEVVLLQLAITETYINAHFSHKKR